MVSREDVQMNVAIRVDASAKIGTGHFMRCLALAEALKETGARVRFAARHLPEALRTMVAEGAHEFVSLPPRPPSRMSDGLAHSDWLETSPEADARDTVAALSDQSWNWLVVDHYALDARWEERVRPAVARILAIDDLADRPHDSDLLLDQNLEVETRYSGKVKPSCRLLLGPRFALLRGEFRELRQQVVPRDGDVRRVLVFVGGIDSQGYTELVIAALQGLESRPEVDVAIGGGHPRRANVERLCDAAGFRCHVQSTRYAELVARADLAIGAGGSSTWERCCLGVPTLTLCVAPNQVAVVEEAARRALVCAQDAETVSAASLAGQLRALVDNRLLRHALSRNGMRAVDGRGAQRVRREMGYSAVAVRPATKSDSDMVFAWRNHPEIRTVSGNTDPIERSVHEAWFAAALEDRDRVVLIGRSDRQEIGIVRFDIMRTEAQVSIYLAPELIGSGKGAELLAAAESWLAHARPEVQAVRGRVLRDNARSHALFRDEGYRLQTTDYSKTIRP